MGVDINATGEKVFPACVYFLGRGLQTLADVCNLTALNTDIGRCSVTRRHNRSVPNHEIHTALL